MNTPASERKEFTLAEALAIVAKNADSYENVPSVSRTLASELARKDAEIAGLRAQVERLNEVYQRGREQREQAEAELARLRGA